MSIVLPPSLKRALFSAWSGMIKVIAKNDIVLWPPVESQGQLDDLAQRVRFYFCNGEKVVIPVISRDLTLTKQIPEWMGEYPQRCRIVLSTVTNRERSTAGLALSHRGLLLHDTVRDESMARKLQYLPNVSPFGPTRVDMEAFWVLKLFERENRAASLATKGIFKKWRAALPKRKKAYLLCTGPSLSKYRDFDFSDGHVIGCNTIVKNRELLNYSQPVAVVAGDPNFFFGPSIYAHNFRQDLRESMRDYPFLFLTFDCYHEIVRHHLSECADRIVLMPQHPPANLPDVLHQWRFPRTANVLTMQMLPLAAAIADEIHILGADGRDPAETYFWKHDPSSQLTEKLKAMKECHPAFFATMDYQDYYERHCDILENQIRTIEARGGRVYSMTDVFTPPLKRRLAPYVAK